MTERQWQSKKSYTVTESCNKKPNRFVQRAQNVWGPVERKGGKKMEEIYYGAMKSQRSK